MLNLWSSPLLRSRFLLASLAGLLWTAAFPRIGIAGLAWVAPAVLLTAALGKRGGEAFRIGYVGGLAHYLSMLYWLLLIPYRWYGLPLGPAVGWLALSAFLALFPAAWVWLTRTRISECGMWNGKLAAGGEGMEAAPQESGQYGWHNSWASRTGWALLGAAIWVALEMVLARILGGFPWELLGASQYPLVPLIQVASVTGVYGVSFLVVWFSLCLVSAGEMILRRPTARSIWVMEIFLPVLVIALLFNFGFHRLRRAAPPQRTLKVTMVQPSIPQTLIWNPSADDERFTALVRLSEQALSNRTDLLVWPEAAVPKLLRWDRATFEAVSGLARRHHVWMIVGADDMEPRPGSRRLEDAFYFNSAFLINPEGDLVEAYRKRSLVIFGEYIPFQNWLPFLKWFTPIQGGFTPGTHAVPFELAGLAVQTSVLICFEDVFPQVGRSSVEPDTDFLVNITNDGWFGEGAAQWQQATTGLFRAVENGVPLLRCTNTGLTCWIDAWGRIQQKFRDPDGSIYGPGYLTVQVPLRAPDERLGPTFYHQHGDWFGWGCVAVGAALLARKGLARMRQYTTRERTG